MKGLPFLVLLVVSLSHHHPTQRHSQEHVYNGNPSVIMLDTCKENNLCNHGTCILLESNNVSCRCEKPYVDYTGEACSKKGKSMVSAFLISFFFGGLGADWFYMSSGDPVYILIGCVKLIILFLLPLSLCWIWKLGILSKWILDSYTYTETDKSGCVWILLFWIMPGILVIICLTGSVWWVVDWARVVDEGRMIKWTDGQGVALFIDLYEI